MAVLVLFRPPLLAMAVKGQRRWARQRWIWSSHRAGEVLVRSASHRVGSFTGSWSGLMQPPSGPTRALGRRSQEYFINI